MQYYQQSVIKTLKDLKVNKDIGLSTKEVTKRHQKHGFNQLEQTNKISPLEIFFNQFKSVLIWILLGATLVSALVGEHVDAIVILVIVIFNAIFGFLQEYKAEKAIESLKKMASPKAKVLRDGEIREIDAKQLTLGDIVILDEGDRVPADLRLIEVFRLEAGEAALTGESTTSAKNTDPISSDVGLGDQKNMVFMGTGITRGRAKGVVVAIGMQTEIGKIADMIQKVETNETPLQKKLQTLSKRLGIITVGICVMIFFVYYFYEHIGASQAFLTAIALAVAAIPEGLPAVVTISLGLGVSRLVKKHALMRRLTSVETLGSVNVICTDKTGTLTKNEMTVTKVWTNNQEITVTGTGYQTEGGFFVGDQAYPYASLFSGERHVETGDAFRRLLEIGVLCNNSQLYDGQIVGDPTEVALLVSGIKAGIHTETLHQDLHKIDEIPFDSARKMMSMVYKDGANPVLFTKGATSVILEKCTKILIDGKVKTLTAKQKEHILSMDRTFASQALRVLGFAYKEVESIKGKVRSTYDENDEEELIFVGLQAMIDPPRSTAKDAISKCVQAGIRVVMITGDHVETAKAIAGEIGITGKAITGMEFATLTKDQLNTVVKEVNIFARVNPEHKQMIVDVLQSQGYIVAMTGDGVNDAPALKKADIGISMGITGTDVAQEASDMVLLNDQFYSIVDAIQEGRGIYDNIKKFVNYLLSSNFGEILLIFTASLLGLPLPLLAIQILWINLVTDGLPALALGVDPIDPSVMKRKPRSKNDKIVSKDMLYSILVIAILMTAFALFFFYRHYETNLVQARTGVFILVVLMELVRIQMIRGRYGNSAFSNKWLIGAVLGSIGLVLLVVYTPLSVAFKTLAPSREMWQEILISLGILGVIGFGMNKLFMRIFGKVD